MIAELDCARREARIDPLTQVWNRRAFEEIPEQKIARGSRTKQPFGIVMLDLDHFKTVNDQFGHDAGDEVVFCQADFPEFATKSSRKTPRGIPGFRHRE